MKIYKMIKIICFLVSFAINVAFSDQSINELWKQYDYIDGISSNYILDIFKDKNGKVYIGTQNGVTVMHGNSLVKYGSKEGLPASDIIKVVRFNDKLYAATRTKGLFVFDGDMFSKSSIIKGENIQTMNILGDNLFISTNLENIFYDGSKVSFIKGFPNTKISDVYFLDEKKWFVSGNKIITKEKRTYKTEIIAFPENRTNITSFLFSNGTEYFGTNNGFFSRDQNKKLKMISSKNIVSISMLKTNDIILGTKKGAYFFKKGSMRPYYPSGDDFSSFKKTPIQDIEVVSNNEVWFSTFGSGIYLHDPGTFENYTLRDGLNTGGMVYDIENVNGLFFIATSNGLFSFKNHQILSHFTKRDGLPSNKILDLSSDSNGVLWIATSKGLSKYDSKTFVSYDKQDGLPSNLITSVHVDNKDESVIWLGSTNSGLTKFDKSGFFTYAVQDGLPSNTIRSLDQKDNGELIIACYNKGVATFNGNSFTLLENGLDDKRVIAVSIDNNNKIWAGTESAGIGVFSDLSFNMIKDSDGLGHNELFSLYNDGQRMWAGTFGGGVSCYDQGTWFTMNESDGLVSNVIGSIMKIDQNKVMIGGTNGISILSLNNQAFTLNVKNIRTPKTDLTLNDLNDEPIRGILNDRYHIMINPLVYKPIGNQIKFRSRLVNISEKNILEWSPLKNSSEISHTAQDIGSYKIQIQAVDNRISVSNIVEIPLKISRVWYLNPIIAVPFWGSIILLITFSAITFINYRKKSKEANDLRDAEIARKDAEMEEAREFQQALLPSKMPITDEYEMVGFQQTATEVGGDFFDFMQKEDGRWVAICGDATGHGLTSGNVVSITKTAMSSLVEKDPVETLDSLNQTLLKMNIGLNRMCLNIANMGENSISFSSAGMPPAYYYSSVDETLEEILVGALPLGSFSKAIHTSHEVVFKNKGDLLIMMSDGLPEAENKNNEMVGYEKTEAEIKSLAKLSAEEIKDGLVKLCSDWLSDGDAELKDDMTFVIIKKK